MIKKNIMPNTKNKPLILSPSYKDYLWGGNRLKDDFGKKTNLNIIAESWECSTHSDGYSYIVDGEFNGKKLVDVLKIHPEYLGIYSNDKGELPILVKLIDAKDNLSIQVHPDDEYALKKANGQLGKTEMWYVLDADDDTEFIYGLNTSLTKEELALAIKNKCIEKYLNKIKVKKNDLFFIEPGTIHAIGAGGLIVEIQENSNLTYRLYDYDRVDSNGKKRVLHIDEALEVINLNISYEPRQPLRVLKYHPGVASELLCQCRYFVVYRMLINTKMKKEVFYNTDELSFGILLCVSGYGEICYWNSGNISIIKISKGDCIFIPANSIDLYINGNMELLDIKGNCTILKKDVNKKNQAAS